MVLLEAMVCGKPIVVSPVGGIPEVVKDFESALFVTPGSITEIAQALISLSTNSALAEKLGQNAQEIARQRYGLPLHIQTLNTLYRSVTAIKL